MNAQSTAQPVQFLETVFRMLLTNVLIVKPDLQIQLKDVSAILATIHSTMA